jgi:hypothetical protein
MKLSDAMVLGSVTCRMVAGDWNACAVGAAANAIGIPPQAVGTSGNDRERAISAAWPWLTRRSGEARCACAFCPEVSWMQSITKRFDDKVCRGQMTFEALVELVKKVEPECVGCDSPGCTCGALMPMRMPVPNKQPYIAAHNLKYIMANSYVTMMMSEYPFWPQLSQQVYSYDVKAVNAANAEPQAVFAGAL